MFTLISPALLLSLPIQLLLGTATATSQPSTINNSPKVSILNGTYHGIHLSPYNEDVFLGIPFAQPPVGSLRFNPPQSLNTTWDIPRNATEYSPECIGYGSDDWVLGNIISEDCLTLNVVRPSGLSPDAKLPVAVWIHGGGNVEGGSRDPRYNLSFIVSQSVEAKTPMIAVSIQYRLSGWGFLFGQEILDAGSANIGFRDQRLALHWIQENIGFFGGAKDEVTIWGESAGASGVGVQLVAYGGRNDGLFRGAITQSGGLTASRRYSTPEAWQPVYNNITAAAGCANTNDTLACLRTVPTELLSSVFNSSVAAAASWGVQIDHDLILKSGTSQLRAGEFVHVPLLTGLNSDEGASFGSRGINTSSQFLAMVQSNGLDNTTTATLAALYPDIPAIGIPATLKGRPPPSEASLGAQWKRAAAYGGDLQMHAQRRLTSQMWAKWNVSSYSYRFNVLVHGVSASIGSSHFQEVAFVFDNTRGEGYVNAVSQNPFEGDEGELRDLARVMSRMWIGFVVGGDPNVAGVSNVSWPSYTLDDPTNIVFDVNVTNLAYVEPDYFRAAGIKYISDRLDTAYGR
ncbi:putative extracellular lipase [Sclerotinia borealis F-4128]|uniref:Carboxylic ester hydrolase n=1 Tax=Sclerotinia borealis (strain F-4128) TaxID=1432307 RepID=W9CRL7_SCLBF|nr:putative extracellular lipase [Sclerotinia borealis F-4128]